jgi:hypothetical protein
MFYNITGLNTLKYSRIQNNLSDYVVRITMNHKYINVLCKNGLWVLRKGSFATCTDSFVLSEKINLSLNFMDKKLV